jgi:hypothetical protein
MSRSFKTRLGLTVLNYQERTLTTERKGQVALDAKSFENLVNHINILLVQGLATEVGDK